MSAQFFEDNLKRAIVIYLDRSNIGGKDFHFTGYLGNHTGHLGYRIATCYRSSTQINNKLIVYLDHPITTDQISK